MKALLIEGVKNWRTVKLADVERKGRVDTAEHELVVVCSKFMTPGCRVLKNRHGRAGFKPKCAAEFMADYEESLERKTKRKAKA